jgi:hypothetical protein
MSATFHIPQHCSSTALPNCQLVSPCCAPSSFRRQRSTFLARRIPGKCPLVSLHYIDSLASTSGRNSVCTCGSGPESDPASPSGLVVQPLGHTTPREDVQLSSETLKTVKAFLKESTLATGTVVILAALAPGHSLAEEVRSYGHNFAVVPIKWRQPSTATALTRTITLSVGPASFCPISTAGCDKLVHETTG